MEVGKPEPQRVESPMAAASTWYRQHEAPERLALIGGLTINILHEAALQGELARAACTANHPPLAGPFNAWADMTRSLRDQLLPLGWTKSDESNYALVISPDGQHGIVVASGDENTGSPVLAPKTKSPKGPRTFEVVNQNAIQLHLFEDPEEATRRSLSVAAAADRLTWFLLTSRVDDSLRGELSLPRRIGDDGRLEHWAERILLPPIPLEGDPARREGPDFGPDFDVDVVRRTA